MPIRTGRHRRAAAGEELELFIDSTQREALHIQEPLWRFSLVEAMIRDMSIGDARFRQDVCLRPSTMTPMSW